MSGGDQSRRINFSHSINEELARSDWMGLSGSDQSGRINSSHSIIQEFARSDWMGLSGSDQTCQNNFPTCQNVHLFAPTKIFSAHPEIISAPPILGPHFDKLGSSTPHGIWLQRY